MGFGTNPAFRSRSLVRSRIGAFRASDAGSNPAGSILILARFCSSSSSLSAEVDAEAVLFGYVDPAVLIEPCRERMRSSSVQLPFRRSTTSGFGPTKTLYVGEAV